MSTTEKPRLKSTDGSDTDSLAANTDELQQDLERRLELLGPPTGNLSSELLSPSLVSDLNGKNKGGAVIHDGEQTNDSTHSNTRKPTVVTNKNVLLARIMAAQERAKEIQQQKTSTSSSPNKLESIDTSINETPFIVMVESGTAQETSFTPVNDQTDIQTDKLKQVDNDYERTQQDNSEYTSYTPLPDADVAHESAGKPTGLAHLPTPSAPPLPFVNAYDRNDSMEPIPLSLDALNNDNTNQVSPPADVDLVLVDFDSDGHQLLSGERVKLIEEQRLIYEKIQQEAQLNDLAIAAAQAEAFDERVNALVSGSTTNVHNLSTEQIALNKRENTRITKEDVPLDERAPTLVDIGGGKKLSLYGTERTVDAIKDGTAILVQCSYCEEWMQITSSAKLMFCPKCKVISEIVRQTAVQTKEQALQLMMDRKLAKEIQEKESLAARSHSLNTSRALDNGGTGPTSSSENISSSYFASFFTTSSNHDRSSNQMDNVNEHGGRGEPHSSSLFTYPGRRSSSDSPLETSTPDIESRYLQDSSFWSYLSSFLPFSGSQQTSPLPRSSEINVSRPPSSVPLGHGSRNQSLPGNQNVTSDQHGHSAVSSDEYDERERLIQRTEQTSSHGNASIWDSSSARVGEVQPLLSCVFDSISHTAVALGSVISSRSIDHEGVDRTSLLVRDRTPRISQEELDGEGSYHQMSDH